MKVHEKLGIFGCAVYVKRFPPEKSFLSERQKGPTNNSFFIVVTKHPWGVHQIHPPPPVINQEVAAVARRHLFQIAQPRASKKGMSEEERRRKLRKRKSLSKPMGEQNSNTITRG
jgi:hypothetical protein